MVWRKWSLSDRGTSQVFAERDWGIPGKPSVRIFWALSEVGNEHLTNRKLKRSQHEYVRVAGAQWIANDSDALKYHKYKLIINFWTQTSWKRVKYFSFFFIFNQDCVALYCAPCSVAGGCQPVGGACCFGIQDRSPSAISNLRMEAHVPPKSWHTSAIYNVSNAVTTQKTSVLKITAVSSWTIF